MKTYENDIFYQKKGNRKGLLPAPPKKKKMKKCDCEAEEREVVAGVSVGDCYYVLFSFMTMKTHICRHSFDNSNGLPFL